MHSFILFYIQRPHFKVGKYGAYMWAKQTPHKYKYTPEVGTVIDVTSLFEMPKPPLKKRSVSAELVCN